MKKSTSAILSLLIILAPAPALKTQRGEQAILAHKVASAGTSLTTNLGGTAGCSLASDPCNNGLDNGNHGVAFFTPFVTPANSTTWSSFNVLIVTPQAATPLSISTVGAMASTGSGVLTAANGPFTPGMVGFPITATLCGAAAGTLTDTILSYQSATQVTLTTDALTVCAGSTVSLNLSETISLYGDQTSGCSGSSPHCPGAFICSYGTSTTQSVGWNVPPMTGCGTPTSSTWYWISQWTNNDSQHQATSGINAFCPGTGGLVTGYALSLTPWPATAPSLDGSPLPTATNGNGCYAAYVSVNYTSTATYNVVSLNPGNCDTASSCPVLMPPVQSGHTLVIETVGSVGSTITSVKDCTNGTAACSTSTDTVNKLGSCPGASGGFQLCFFEIDRATAGINNVTCTFATSGSAKDSCWILEIQGTTATPFDQVNYDSVYLTATPFTSANGVTTTSATELLIGGVTNGWLQSNPYGQGNFGAGGSWTTLFTGGLPGGTGAPTAAAVYLQTVNSTGTYNVQGTYSLTGSGNEILPGLITLH